MPRLSHLTAYAASLGMALSVQGSHTSFGRIAAPATVAVRLCSSGPLTAPSSSALARGIANAVMLATEEWKPRFRAAHLSLLNPVAYDDSSRKSDDVDSKREVRNAQECVRRHDAFGYVGPLYSGVAFLSAPILNRAGMLQISPSNTNPVLTDPRGWRDIQPATYTRRLRYPTYYRTVTTDALQGPAMAAYLKDALHGKSYFLVTDSYLYGSIIGRGIQAYSTRIGLQSLGSAQVKNAGSGNARGAQRVADLIVQRAPDGVLWGGQGFTAVALLKDLRQDGYHGPVITPDAVFGDPRFLVAVGSAQQNTFSVNLGPDVQATARSFRQAYARRFHVPLQPYGALAYDAANIELNALAVAATHGFLHGNLFSQRASLLPYVALGKWHGATGVTSFNADGDTRNTVFSVYVARAGHWKFAGTAPTIRGLRPCC